MKLDVPPILEGTRLLEVLQKFLIDVAEAAQETFSSHHKGTGWEKRFKDECKQRGLKVEKVVDGRHDMEVAGWRVQCKAIDELRSGWAAIDNMRPVKANEGIGWENTR